MKKEKVKEKVKGNVKAKDNCKWKGSG